MKKRKRDILIPIIIILVMALIFVGYQLVQKNQEQEKAPIEIRLTDNKSASCPVMPEAGEQENDSSFLS